jgi:hypothetical protein
VKGLDFANARIADRTVTGGVLPVLHFSLKRAITGPHPDKFEADAALTSDRQQPGSCSGSVFR